MAVALKKLEGERVELRPLKARDAQRLAELTAPYEVSSMLARMPHPYTLAEAEAFLARELSGAGADANYAIDAGAGLIGIVSFTGLASTPELGYWLGRPYWGRGLMTEAARMALAWFFAATAHPAVIAGAFADNPASLCVQRKLGFTVTGLSKVRSEARNRLVDHYDTRLLRADFESSRR